MLHFTEITEASITNMTASLASTAVQTRLRDLKRTLPEDRVLTPTKYRKRPRLAPGTGDSTGSGSGSGSAKYGMCRSTLWTHVNPGWTKQESFYADKTDPGAMCTPTYRIPFVPPASLFSGGTGRFQNIVVRMKGSSVTNEEEKLAMSVLNHDL